MITRRKAHLRLSSSKIHKDSQQLIETQMRTLRRFRQIEPKSWSIRSVCITSWRSRQQILVADRSGQPLVRWRRLGRRWPASASMPRILPWETHLSACFRKRKTSVIILKTKRDSSKETRAMAINILKQAISSSTYRWLHQHPLKLSKWRPYKMT